MGAARAPVTVPRWEVSVCNLRTFEVVKVERVLEASYDGFPTRCMHLVNTSIMVLGSTQLRRKMPPSIAAAGHKAVGKQTVSIATTAKLGC